MLSITQIDSLSQLPAPLLTAYLHTNPGDACLHGTVPGHLAWLRSESQSLVHDLPPTEQEHFQEQLNRMEEFLQHRTPHEKSLVIFASPTVWEIVPLQLQVKNELRWGKPALEQLVWLAGEHTPSCIVVVDQAGARFFRYWLNEMTEFEEKKFAIDISEWKKKDLGKFMRKGIKKTRGSQRNTFEHRMDAQYAHLCRQTAQQVKKLCAKEHLRTVFLVGSDRLIKPIQAEFPQEFHPPVVLIELDLARVSLLSLHEHLGPRIADWEHRQEAEEVSTLLSDSRGVVAGFDETLAQLQKKKIRTLVLAQDLDASLRRCVSCGWTDRSADPVCPSCGGERRDVLFRDVLLELARKSKADIQVVTGEAAWRLKEADGMAAWLREPKQLRARAAR